MKVQLFLLHYIQSLGLSGNELNLANLCINPRQKWGSYYPIGHNPNLEIQSGRQIRKPDEKLILSDWS
jgi:hypothetical protein